MSIKTRVSKLEHSYGTKKLNIAVELDRLKAEGLAGRHRKKTKADYERLIAECKNAELQDLYRRAMHARFRD